MQPDLNIDFPRLVSRLEELGEIGGLPDGGVTRLALSDEDRAARDLVVGWMEELGMEVLVDGIGNIIALREGLEDNPPVMAGSHLDTVRSGGTLDGSYGVVAALEVIAALNEGGVETRLPVAVAVFTNEEGARYTPDMMGSLVYTGGYPLEDALSAYSSDGTILGDELRRIGYAGEHPCGGIVPAAFLELHIEQGPYLENRNIPIGAVEKVTGISWREITITGEANHAGTTPMEDRRDAAAAAAAIISYVREMASAMGGGQRGTCGALELSPNVVNVIPGRAVLTVDLRNSDEEKLRESEYRLSEYLDRTVKEFGVKVSSRRLARYKPVDFSGKIVGDIEEAAGKLEYGAARMTSGAGHDAQLISRICPAAMIFVPSRNGVSHSPAEYTAPEFLKAGADVLLRCVLRLAEPAG